MNSSGSHSRRRSRSKSKLNSKSRKKDNLDPHIPILIKDVTFDKGSINTFRERKYRYPQGEDYDFTSSSFGLESPNSPSERQLNEFEAISFAEFENEGMPMVRPHNQHASSLQRVPNQRRSNSRSKPSSRSKQTPAWQEKVSRNRINDPGGIREIGSDRARQAEIENVILKQILRSNSRIYEDEEDDDGHLSVATGAMSVMSTYTTREILGDLTDHEDTRSVQRSRRSRSVSRIRSSSTKSRRAVTHGANTESKKEKVRSKSVVSRRVRLKDICNDTNIDDSSQLYDSFMKNMPREGNFLYSNSGNNSISRKTTKSTADQWDPFEKSLEESFGQDNPFLSENHEVTSSSIHVKKPTLRRLSSEPVSNLFSEMSLQKAQIGEKSVQKPSLGRHSSLPGDVSRFPASTAFSTQSRTKIRPTSKRKDDQVFKQNRKTSFFPEESFKNSRSTAVFSFDDNVKAHTRKVRQKPLFEDKEFIQLSPVKSKHEICWNQTTSQHSFVPKINQENTTEEWELFGETQSQTNSTGLGICDKKASSINPSESLVEASKHALSTWATVPEETKKDTTVKEAPPNTIISHRKNNSGNSFESFPNPSWGTDDFDDVYDSRDQEIFSNEIDFNDDDGFKLLGDVAKYRKPFDQRFKVDIHNQDDDCFKSPTTRAGEKNHIRRCANDKVDWDDWGKDKVPHSFEECDISKLSASTISYKGSPSTISSSLENGKCDSSGITLPTVSSSRSTPTINTVSDESSISNRFRTSPTVLKSSPSDSRSQFVWNDVSPSDVTKFSSSASRKKLFNDSQ